ncbi:PIN domain-containing protein [bacterium]|nr:PIN domain-containing protein [bacterium]
MTRTFVDTAFVVALVNSNDQYHAKAQNLSEMYETEPLITTDVVLLEIGNALARDYKKEAIEIIESFRTSKEVLIVELSLEFFDKAFELYKKYTDKDWGMVDCISFIVMREYEVRNALTFDDHFRQAGFNVLMKN